MCMINMKMIQQEKESTYMIVKANLRIQANNADTFREALKEAAAQSAD